ncbi:MAG TPA: endonuclease/exonuclease/phosphatase family protein [Aestuariivirga sp.]|nr:endonuclease/exonuclease/phosphatase family protein [Alphaproteobacteria bacterium]HRX35267.1 endonuclease/exonuclease/phosphatase family protein [Aestuariivirga sp.]
MSAEERPVSDVEGERQVQPAAQLTVASYNIHKCVGTDGKFEPLRIKRVLLELDADIIALQEADARFGDRQGLLDLELLQHLGGYQAVADVGSRTRSHGWHGNVILYRNGRVRQVQRLDLPGLEPRGALVADIDLADIQIRIIAAHLGLLRRSRSLQVTKLLAAAQPDDGRPVVVMGDMNEWRMAGRSALRMFDPHLSNHHGAVPSFPSRMPLWPLDRILVTRDVDVVDFMALDTPLARVASDHLPVRAQLSILAGAGIRAAMGT